MLLTILLYAAAVAGAAIKPATVKLDGATVVGTSDGTVTQFLGIPFAQPPYVYVYALTYTTMLMTIFPTASGNCDCSSPSPCANTVA